MRLAATAIVFAALGYVGAGLAQREGTQRFEVVATKYRFSQDEIRVKRGRPLTLRLTTPDFPHGFSVPDFNVRADLIPGKTVTVSFTPQRAGRFVFLCDNFCGEAHDRMSGFLIVEE